MAGLGTGLVFKLKKLVTNFKIVAKVGTLSIIKMELSANNQALQLAAELLISQLEQGKDGEGNTIQDGYSDSHTKARNRRDKQTAFVDYNFSGDFYESIFARVSPNPEQLIEILSKDPKFKHVLGHYQKYGGHEDARNLMVLNESNYSKFTREIGAQSIKRIKNELFGT